MALLDTMGLKRVPGTILPKNGHPAVHGVPDLGMAAVRMIPDNCYILAHVPSTYQLEGLRVITVFRDPRNVLVSYCRYRNAENGLNVRVHQALDDFYGSPFCMVYRGYLGWRGRSLCLRYEEIPEQVAGQGQGIYAREPRDWNTRTGKPSRWQDWWDEEAQAAWIRTGGLSLLHEAGYT
jgi:hypothetical protein